MVSPLSGLVLKGLGSDEQGDAAGDHNKPPSAEGQSDSSPFKNETLPLHSALSEPSVPLKPSSPPMSVELPASSVKRYRENVASHTEEDGDTGLKNRGPLQAHEEDGMAMHANWFGEENQEKPDMSGDSRRPADGEMQDVEESTPQHVPTNIEHTVCGSGVRARS